MSIAEAMVHGAVPVSSEYTGIHVENVIRPNETGVLFPVGRPDMAADRIVELDRDSSRLTTLQGAAKQEITVRHSLEQFGDRWNDCLLGVLERNPSAVTAVDTNPGPRLANVGKEWARRFLRRSVAHHSIRAEWPMIAPRDERLTAAVQDRLSELG